MYLKYFSLGHNTLSGNPATLTEGYGFSWTQASTITATRLKDAEGLNRIDFDNLSPWKDMKRCMVNDDKSVNYYIDSDFPNKIGRVVNPLYTQGDDADYSGAHGQVMVEIPRFYYASANPSAKVYEYYVSPVPSKGFQIHPAFVRNGEKLQKVYYSAFEGFYQGGKMASIAGVVPSTSDGKSDEGFSPIAAYPATVLGTHGIATNGGDIRNCRYWAQQRGVGWGIHDFLTICAWQLLYMVEYANWNSQNMIGKGIVDKVTGTNNRASKTGATIFLGNTSGREGGTDGLTSVSYRGIENPWGNIYKWVDGINLNNAGDYGVYVADHDFESDKFTGNYEKIATFPSTASAWRNITDISYARGYSFFPATASGTTYTTYLCDGLYSSTTSTRVARFGGIWADGLPAGAFCWTVSNDSSYADRYLGSRLLLLP